MKTIKDNDGKYLFDYNLDGLLFLGPTHVLILQRASGRQATVTIGQLKETLKQKDFKKIENALLLDNSFINNTYHIIGVDKP